MKKDFIWGVATASYQIEGHFNEFRTIWDNFAEQEGKVFNHENGEVACNHLNMFEEDVKLISELGVDYYRFSISWARIMPKKGVVSEIGLAFYENLLIALEKANIKSNVTMYHWDMPEWVYLENGGWTSEDTIEYFLDYAKIILKRLDKYVDVWSTLNEPYCSSFLGYFSGNHAPGHKNLGDFIKSSHFLLLAHGKVVNYYRDNFNKEIGIVLNLSHVLVNEESVENEIAIRMQDATLNKMYLEPIFKGKYPAELMSYFKDMNVDLSFIKKEDMKIISSSIDILGINYYTHSMVKYNENNEFFVEMDDTDLPKTSMGWDITPDALGEVIKRVRTEYTDLPIYITENGAAFEDEVIDGEVKDSKRIEYINSHIDLVLNMKDEYNVKGYYVWSLLDNFEWAFGYSKRFGIVHVDFETGKRTPKESYQFLKDKFKENSF